MKQIILIILLLSAGFPWSESSGQFRPGGGGSALLSTYAIDADSGIFWDIDWMGFGEKDSSSTYWIMFNKLGEIEAPTVTADTIRASFYDDLYTLAQEYIAGRALNNYGSPDRVVPLFSAVLAGYSYSASGSSCLAPDSFSLAPYLNSIAIDTLGYELTPPGAPNVNHVSHTEWIDPAEYDTVAAGDMLSFRVVCPGIPEAKDSISYPTLIYWLKRIP